MAALDDTLDQTIAENYSSAPVVQKVDNAIHPVNLCPMDSAIIRSVEW